MDPSEDAPGSLDDDASSSDGASSVDYISEASEESTASEAAAAALEDVIDAVERRVDRQRRRVLRCQAKQAVTGLHCGSCSIIYARCRGRTGPNSAPGV